LIHFQTLDLTQLIMCSVDPNMGNINGTSHIKTVFNFSPGTGKHFIVKSLFSSGDSVTQFITMLHILTMNLSFKYSQKEKSRGANCGKCGGWHGMALRLPIVWSGNSPYDVAARVTAKTIPVSLRHLSQHITGL